MTSKAQRTIGLSPAAVFVGVVLLMDAFALGTVVRHIWSGPVANDWLSFYTGGTLVRTGQAAHLYDASAQDAIQRGLLGADFDMVIGFLLPAFVAFFFAPLSKLSLAMSYTVWLAINIAMLGLLLRLSWRWLEAVPQALRSVFLACAVSVPVVDILMQGQVDLFILAGLAGCYALLRDGRPALGGSALALALFKPHLAAAVVLLLLVKRQWRALAAFAVTGGMVMLAPALFLGPHVLVEQVRLLSSFTGAETNQLVLPLDTMINIRATVTSLTGSLNVWLWLPLLALIATASLALAVRVWMARPALHPQSWALAFTLPLLYSPHVHIQSMVLLIAAAGLYLIASQSSARPIVDIKYALFGFVAVTVLWSLSLSGPSFMALLVMGAFALFWQRWPEPAAEALTIAPRIVPASVPPRRLAIET